MTTGLSAIDFTADLAKLTKDFTGRQWVFDDIDRWLKESEERFFILTGEPGVGKSAIVARLTQIRDDIAAYHFCRANDVETVRPARILRSLAAQLGEHLTDYGQALANTIKPIHLRVEVNITIGSMTGSQVTGVYIENLKESDPENELDILIRAPLEELQKMYAERQQAQPTLAIILIDSLDEAVTTTGTTLVKLLTQLSKSISLPSWVRFVMTSRPERRVLRGFEPLKPYHLREKSDASLADVRQYVEDRVDQPALQDQLQVNQIQPQTLINEITNLSKGNFLYTTLLLNDIEAGRQALDNLAALPKSIDDIYHGFLSRFSEEDWSDHYKPIFGVLTVAQEPISEKQISKFTKLDPEDVRDSVRIAQQFFDVELDEQNKETYSIFHQSLRDYLLDEDRNRDFWCNERKQHQRIIDFYERTSKSWQELERIDAYGRKHLAQHLVKAKRVEELHTLLSLEKDGKNAWFKVKDDGGDTAGFLRDLDLAWLQAEKADGCELGEKIGLQCRYALVRASINSLAGIPKELLVALVKHPNPYWKAAKALAYARQIPEPCERFMALALLACQFPSSEPLKPQILQSTLEAATAIEDEHYRVDALGTLASKLPPDLLPKVLEAATAIEDESHRADALGTLAGKLPPDLLPKVLEAATAIEDESHRADALGTLAGKLLPDLLPKVLEAATAIEDEHSRARALGTLAGKLPPDLLPKVLEAATAIEDEHSRARALGTLADKLPPDLLPKVLEAAAALKNEYSRAEALGTLAGKLPPDLLPKVLEAAAAFEDEYSRDRALDILAGVPSTLLPPDSILNIIKPSWKEQTYESPQQLLETALGIKGYYHHRNDALIDLVDKLPPEVLPQALEVALNIPVEFYRVLALMDLADKLPPEMLSQVLEESRYTNLWELTKFASSYDLKDALDIKNADELPIKLLPQALEVALGMAGHTISVGIPEHITSLAYLADKLPPELLPKALKGALATQNHIILRTLVDKLPPELFPQALKVAQKIGDEEYRTHALMALAGKLPPDLLNLLTTDDLAERATVRECLLSPTLATLIDKLSLELLPKVLEAALAIENPYSRAKALEALVDELPPEMFSNVLEVDLAVEEEYYCPKALEALVDKLPPEMFSNVLEAALAVEEEYYRVHALEALADKFPQALPKALEAALAIEYAPERAQVLRALVDKLPEAIPEALKAALAIEYAPERTQALLALVDKLPKALPKVLEEVLDIQDESDRFNALAVLSCRLIDAPDCIILWRALLHFLSYRTRPNLLSDLTALAPVIVAFGEKTIADTAQAIQDVSRWWP